MGTKDLGSERDATDHEGTTGGPDTVLKEGEPKGDKTHCIKKTGIVVKGQLLLKGRKEGRR